MSKNNTEAKKEEKNIPQNVAEYQPDALELKNARLPLVIRLCVFLPFVVLAAAIAWSIWAKVDVVVQGNGKIVTDEPTVMMKPLERSVIKQIHVSMGDVVKKGQTLISFDPTINNAEADRLNNEMEALQAELNRLRAEFQDTPYTGGSSRFEKWQKAIYDQRQSFYKEKMTYYAEALSQIAASTKSKTDTLAKQQERLTEFQKLENMYKRMEEQDVASFREVTEISISRMEMEANVDLLKNDLLELQHRKGTLNAEKNSFIQEWRNRISEDMVNVDRNLTSLQKEYEKVKQLIEYVVLTAPCDAIVHEIAAFSPGSAVREAETLISLVPLNGAVELESEIRPQDIGKVKVGSEVRIKLSAYPYQKYGTLTGKVLNISENTLQKNEGPASISYYRARISIEGKLKGIEDYRLIPGMEAQGEIKCDNRRVIEYVLYPLIKALDETAREP